MQTAKRISAIILAGGRAKRMDGIDKGLVLLNGKPLIQYVIESLSPQVDEILINANRETDQYETFQLPLLKDETPGFIGPLAGFYLGLNHCQHEYILTAPCDSPLIPNNLVAKLTQSLINENADIAVAKSGDHAHPVMCLMKKSVLPSLKKYIDHGGRKVSTWQKSLNYVEVNFMNDAAFTNVNTFEELKALALK